jgi:hypothetical protein
VRGALERIVVLGSVPFAMSAISPRIPTRASANRSSSALDSLSVGSIMSVPGTGNEIVGAWNP